MNKKIIEFFKKPPIRLILPIIGIILVILFALLLLWQGNSNSNQSTPAYTASVYFEGQYRIGDGDFKDIKKGEHISSTQGDVKFDIAFDKETRTITFRMADKDIPFDPLKKPEPDITLSAEEREIGGLGIFITKKTMDQVNYAYENGENILTMMKKI